MDHLNNMVYMKFNTRMLSKRQRLKDKKKADSLLSNDASKAQGWLFEGGDDHALVVFRDEEDGDQGVHPATGILMSTHFYSCRHLLGLQVQRFVEQ
jgi:hypothetical protein